MKKFLAIILVLVTCCGVFACKKAEDYTNLNLNVASFGQNVINQCNKAGAFDVAPEAVDFVDPETFRIDPADLNTVDGKPEIFYGSTGEQSADFVIVLGAKDAETAKKLSEGAVKEWIDSLKKDAGYKVEEAGKLDSIINKVAGRYVIVICSKDSAACEKELGTLLTNALKVNG